VFCKKRLQVVENKGQRVAKREARELKRLESIEAARVRAAARVESARPVRDNTRNGTTILYVCQ
jgi:hypothetical protein